MKRPHPFLRVILFGLLFLALLTVTRWFQENSRGDLIYEAISDYSHIRVRENKGVRSLLFVDERGREQLQSSIDLADPGSMQVPYTRTMFASLLFKADQRRILVVGLGGGGMVRFAEKALPVAQVEAVEIDPAVVQVAADYFETREGERVRIHIADAFEFLRQENGPYDAIYMDAFLKPRADPDLAELTKRLKTVEFLRDVKARLAPDGVIAFNLVAWSPSTRGNIASIREVFPSIYEFTVPGTGNLIVIATQSEDQVSGDQLDERVRTLEFDLPFGEFVENLKG